MFDRHEHNHVHHHHHRCINEDKIMAKLDDLKGAITAEDAEIKRVLATFPQSIADAVAAARAGDDAQVDEIIADVKAQTDALTATNPLPPAAPAATP